jgi:hypothetical protein
MGNKEDEMTEAELVEDLLVGQRFEALEKMSVDAIKIEMTRSIRTGVPFSADLLVTGATMFHLRVEHDGIQFVGRIFRGFSIDPMDQIAIVDNGFNGVAEAAYEAIAAPEVVDTVVLELEC